MQYETVILEMLSRIKNLEDRVEKLESELNNRQEENFANSQTVPARIKITAEMTDACYNFGKIAYEDNDADISELAERASMQTGMNKSSAYITIFAVKALLQGEIFKRAVSAKALESYFVYILDDYGKNGLQKALSSMKKHIEYRKSKNQNVNILIELCETFETRL